MSHSVETIRGRKVAFTYGSGAQPLPGYTIKRGIGVGGFGEVYFAISDAGKEVALKRIQRNLDIELRGVRQCLNLKHVNLISLWDICANDRGESWVVMEFVPGESLRDVVERHPQGMPLAEIHRWFRSTAAGVQYLHNNGIIHRDLKPGNIFYDADEQIIKIGDYGLSKYLSCSRRSGQTESVGTFHYMAPEIGKGVYGKEIDIYALGVILYEMLTARLPFDGESAQEIIMKHLTSDVDLDPIPAEFRTVIVKSLAKDPEDRYRSVEQLMADFPPLPPDAQAKWDQYQPQVAATKATPTRHQHTAPYPAQRLHDSVAPPASFPLNDSEIVFGPVTEIVEDVRVVHHTPLMFLEQTAPQKPAEPIAEAVRSGWGGVVNWWNNSQLGTPLKAVLLVGGVILLIVNAAWLVPVGVLLAFFYLVYLLIRTWVQPAETPVQRTRKISRGEFDLLLRQTLQTKSASERWFELIGSLVSSGIACAAFGLAAFAMVPAQGAPGNVLGLALWIATTSAIATWSILVVSKFWELLPGDHLSRRFWMLVLGLVVGALAFVLGMAFRVDFPALTVKPVLEMPPWDIRERLIDPRGYPTLGGFLLMFAPLFAAVRWWRQADSARKTRLSIIRVGFCWIVALVIAEAIGFPQVAASVFAIATSVAVQVSAPWVNRLERSRIRNTALASQRP